MKIILIALFSWFHIAIVAQIPTFPTENAKWEMDLGFNVCIGGSNKHIYWTDYLDGDTLVEGISYSKLMMLPHCYYTNPGTHNCYQFSLADQGVTLVGGIREDSGKVVFRRFDVPDSLFHTYGGSVRNIPQNEDFVIYDLNWVSGDSIYYPLIGGDSLAYDVLGVQLYNGKKRFGLQPRNGHPMNIYTTLEGMGGQKGLFGMYYHAGYFWSDLCFYQENELEWGSNCETPCGSVATELADESIIQIYPNPTSDEIFIDVESLQQPVKL